MSSKPQTKPRCPSNGTVVITGANGSLALMFVENLLRKYPSYHAILAVRDASDDDQNTIRLREIVNNAMNDKVSIEAVDLASLSSVRNFADSVFGRVSTQKLPPISAVVCNAFNWSLTGQQNSPDGFDLCFEVSHLSHFVLVLKLLGSMDKASGRVVLLGSDAHYTDRTNAARKLGSAIPENIEELIRPTSDKPGTEFDRGFQRYGTAKLASIMFMHMLNRKLLQDPSLRTITAISMDPGGLPTSRAFDHAPTFFRVAMYITGHVVLPVAKYFTNAAKPIKDIAADLVALAVGPEHQGERGYFSWQKPTQSSKESQDEVKQEELWQACEKWANFESSETVLK